MSGALALIAGCSTHEELLVVVPLLDETEALVVVVQDGRGEFIEARAIDPITRQGSPFSPSTSSSLEETYQLTSIEYGRPLAVLELRAGSLAIGEVGCPIPARPLRAQRLAFSNRSGQWVEQPGIPPDLDALRFAGLETCAYDCGEFVVDRTVELPLVGPPGFAFALDDHRLLVGVSTPSEAGLYVVDAGGGLNRVTDTSTIPLFAGARVRSEVWLGGDRSRLIRAPITDIAEELTVERAEILPAPAGPLAFRRLAHSGETVFAHTLNRRILSYADDGSAFRLISDSNRPQGGSFARGGLIATKPNEALLAFPDEASLWLLTADEATRFETPNGMGVSALAEVEGMGTVLGGQGWAGVGKGTHFEALEVSDTAVNLDALIPFGTSFVWAGNSGTVGEYSAERKQFCPRREGVLRYHARIGLVVGDSLVVVSDSSRLPEVHPAVTFFHLR
ncbi:MAG: hypothetical protein HY791_11760 [Deltaproteobacteria bacterium]|nr:hypothetical protein [Deltaproteobacteria bacterium]